MGDHTAGSSGNPRQLTLSGGITVNLPRWLTLKPNGKPLDKVGLLPDVKIEVAPGDFTADHDPVIDAACAQLRSIPADKRQAGRRVDDGV